MKSILFTLLLSTGLSINGFTQEHEILSYFYNVDGNDQIILKWAIVNGRTCNGIKIYRSTDDVNYTEVGEILGICGSTTEEVPYTFEDKNPVSNQKNYYKLELGFQGFSTPLTTTFFNTEDNGYSIYPNPGRDKMQLFIAGNGSKTDLIVYDITGKVSGYFTSESGKLTTIPTSDWKTGIYFVKIIKAGEVIATAKWIKN